MFIVLVVQKRDCMTCFLANFSSLLCLNQPREGRKLLQFCSVFVICKLSSRKVCCKLELANSVKNSVFQELAFMKSVSTSIKWLNLLYYGNSRMFIYTFHRKEYQGSAGSGWWWSGLSHCASQDDAEFVFQSKNFLIAIYSFCFFASPRWTTKISSSSSSSINKKKKKKEFQKNL